MGLKSKLAFEATVRGMNAELYMWTFTNKDVELLSVTAKRWHRFCSNPSLSLRAAFPGIAGVRVFEMHAINADGECHGWHVHALVNQYLPVDIVRILAEHHGFGRIHVKQIPRERALYAGKYLAKSRRESMTGVRLWAAFGCCDAVKVRDIRVESRWTDVYALLKRSIHGWNSLPWRTRVKIITMFLWGRGEEAMKAMKFRPANDRETEEEREFFWASLQASIDAGEM